MSFCQLLDEKQLMIFSQSQPKCPGHPCRRTMALGGESTGRPAQLSKTPRPTDIKRPNPTVISGMGTVCARTLCQRRVHQAHAGGSVRLRQRLQHGGAVTAALAHPAALEAHPGDAAARVGGSNGVIPVRIAWGALSGVSISGRAPGDNTPRRRLCNVRRRAAATNRR
jgi:hypothetical protein